MKNRPSGLKYKIVAVNKGWFKKGSTSWVKGKKGLCLNTGRTHVKKGVHLSKKTEFKDGDGLGNKNNKWRGDGVRYQALHSWLTRNYGRPDKCDKCDSTVNVQWASKNYKYSRSRKDWIKLCFRCHRQYDVANGWGVASKMFPEITNHAYSSNRV